MFHSDAGSPAVRFWVSGLCMAAAGIVAPGAVIGIASFPLLLLSLGYGLRGFSLLSPASGRSSAVHFLLFTVGLIGAELASVFHGAMAFAYTHPESHGLPPPPAATLIFGLLPVALCIYAVDRRLERGWAVAVLFLLSFLLVNPAVLVIGSMLHLPASRGW